MQFVAPFLLACKWIASINVQDVACKCESSVRGAIWMLMIASSCAIETSAKADSISRDAALRDIDAFVAGLDDQFAYRHWKGVDLQAALQPIRESLDESVDVNELADDLHRVLMRFGDGHAAVRSPSAPESKLFPPALFLDVAGGVVAVRPDRSGFLDPQRPYITAIDGRPIDQWLDLMRPWIVDGSPQWVRTVGLYRLHDLARVRSLTGMPDRPHLDCLLESAKGDVPPAQMSLRMVPDRPSHGEWPLHETGLLEGNIGYIRLPQMDHDLVPRLRTAMTAFRETDGLIVDVRGNGGGSRDLLIAFGGYLLGPDDDPWVASVARYRLSDRFGRDHLVARFMYREDDGHWNERQREAIRRFKPTLQPKWDPGDGFSAWHYLVLDRTGHAGEYHYDRSVVVLSDSWCFSATDIFLGALRGRPGITLLGTASGGGSARSRSFQLPDSGIHVRCASMASFRPDGRPYDGLGVGVDVEVRPIPEDELTSGHDAVLEAAIRQLQGSAEQ